MSAAGLLLRMTGRYLGRHGWQTGLSVLGIALGVAVVVAVDLANQSARRAFDLSMETLTGRASHHIVGGPNGFDEALYTRLRVERGLQAAAPVVEGLVTLHGQTLRLIGIDPFAEGRTGRPLGGVRGPAVRRLLAEPGTVWVSRAEARRLGVEPGDRLELAIAGRSRAVEVVGVVAPRRGAAAGDLLVADIATAQELFGRLGRLDRIDLFLPEAGDERLTALRAALPQGVRVEAAAARRGAALQLTRAFRTNLTAMSLLALLVGGFLIYNTMTFSVLRRRALLGGLRVLGLTRRGLFVLVLAEALLIGAVGTALGLAGGTLLGEGLVRLVTRTINDLYFVLTVTDLLWTPASYLKGLALGLGVTALAAAVPAREAAGTAPHAAQHRAEVEHRARRGLPWLAGLGAALGMAGLAVLAVPDGGLVAGFAGLFLLVLGASCLVPLAVVGLGRAAAAPLGRLFGALGGLTARGLVASLSRSGVAVTALAVAVSATVGMGVMVSSFRLTVSDWLHTLLQSDLYISAPGRSSSRAEGAVSPELIERLRDLEGVAALSLRRGVEVRGPDGPVELLAWQLAPCSRAPRLKAGRAGAWQVLLAGEAVWITEPYAYHHDLGPGDRLVLYTDRGRHAFPIAGVYYDYGADRGRVAMARSLYRQWWEDAAVSSVGVRVASGADPQAVLAEVRGLAATLPQRLRVRSNQAVREVSLEVFDRTFAITRVLRSLAVAVAFIGVLSALMALQLERAREHAVLRATGVTPGQLFAMVSGQTGMMGLAAGVLALPLGLGMAQVLIHVINRRAFGWSIETAVPPGVLAEAVALAVGAALLAGLYPAWRMARTAPAAALREE